MEEKYIQQPITSIPEKIEKLLEPVPFDIRTKANGSKNYKVKRNQQLQEYQKQKSKESGMHRALSVIEQEIMETAAQGPVVMLSTEWIDNLHRVFM